MLFFFFLPFEKRFQMRGWGGQKKTESLYLKERWGRAKIEKEVYAKSRRRRSKAGRPKSFGTLYLYFSPSHVHTFPPITNLYNHHPSF